MNAEAIEGDGKVEGGGEGGGNRGMLICLVQLVLSQAVEGSAVDPGPGVSILLRAH